MKFRDSRKIILRLALTVALSLTGVALARNADESLTSKCGATAFAPDHWRCYDAQNQELVEFKVIHVPEKYEGGVDVRHNGGERNRSFTFHSRGSLMVFLWNEADDPAKKLSSSTGSRTYWFFPVGKVAPTILEGTKSVLVTSSAGVDVSIAKATGQIESISRADFVENPNIPKIRRVCNEDKWPGSCGGFDIVRAKFGIVWDLGWRGGGTTLNNPDASGKLIDKRARTCAIKNKELFDYARGRDTPVLRYPTSASLAEFLSQRCPKLDVSDLLLPEAEAAPEGAPEPSPEAPGIKVWTTDPPQD